MSTSQEPIPGWGGSLESDSAARLLIRQAKNDLQKNGPTTSERQSI
jgi:hypothetical protein